jgi:hypothetical protein
MTPHACATNRSIARPISAVWLRNALHQSCQVSFFLARSSNGLDLAVHQVTSQHPDSIQRQTLECEARNMPFTFDAEAVCGIKLATSTTISTTATSTATSSSTASATSASTTAASSAGTTGASSTGTSGVSSTASPTSSGVPTPTSASSGTLSEGILSNGVSILVAVCGLLLW